MTADGSVLVVGADGAIGAAVAARLEVGGHPVIRTSRRGTPGTVPLDLATDPATWRLPKGVSTAVLCAAVTSTEACRNHPDEARRVNVEATVELGRRDSMELWIGKEFGKQSLPCVRCRSSPTAT